MVASLLRSLVNQAVPSRGVRGGEFFYATDLASKFQTLANALGWSRGKEGEGLDTQYNW